MRLRPFFKYFGAKYRLAPIYPSPKFTVIREPFAGSAQYSTYYHWHQIELYEKDPEIAELWRWLIEDARPIDIARLPYKLTPGLDIRSCIPDEPLGAQLLIRHWQRVGRSTCWTVSNWNGSNSGLWCKSTRDAIAKQVYLIKHWKITHTDAMPVLKELGHDACTWFVDPPYATQATVYGNEHLDYGALTNFCKNAYGQVIACEAPGAHWLPFETLANNTVGRTNEGGTRARRTELVWTKD